MAKNKEKKEGVPRNPNWIEEMHAHYRNTGTYRMSDMHRVLGDQSKSVELEARTDLKVAAQIKR